MTESHCLISSAFEPQLRYLETSRSWTIGRDSEAGLQLLSDQVSRQHARLSFNGSTFVAEDLGSKNGIRVNGERARHRALEDGDVIRVGPFDLRYRVFSGDVRTLLDGSPPAGLGARFAPGELIEVGSLLEVKKLSGTLAVKSSAAEGWLAIARGVVVAARSGALDGAAAARRLLAVSAGEYVFTSADALPEGSLTLPLGDLLIEVMEAESRVTASPSSPGDYAHDVMALRKRLYAARAETQALTERTEFGLAFGLVLAMLFVYTITLAVMERHPGWVRQVSAGAALFFLAVFGTYLARSPYPIATFGLTVKNWRRSLVESLAWTAAALLVLVGGRLLRPDLAPGRPLFVERLDWSLVAYFVQAPVQELVLHGGLQGSLQRFLVGRRATLWAVSFCSLCMGITHLHLSLTMCFVTLFASFGWGLLYARHKTLVGVSVSHLIVGLATHALWAGVIPGVWD
jgi:hypothetical protein